MNVFLAKNDGAFRCPGLESEFRTKRRVKMRPHGLPEYKTPPLNEVAFGIQFSPAPHYSQIHAGEVFNLFKSDFPKVAEHGALPPMFETFGLSSQQAVQFGFGGAARHDRFWFISDDDRKLLQFQQDRVHLNWRNSTEGGEIYPRFDTMIFEFQNCIEKLEIFFRAYGLESLSCNQVELAYINHIKPGKSERYSDLIKLGGELISRSDDFALNYRRVIKDDSGKPTGRLISEVATALDQAGKELLLLNLTVRGAPADAKISSAVNFLNDARITIVNEFTDITTKDAHVIWGRV